MVRVLTIIALLVTITAGSILAYRNQPYQVRIERAGEVKADRETVRVADAPPMQLPSPFGPVPHVTVNAVPAAPAPVAAPSTAPTPAPVTVQHKKPKPKHRSVSKLKSKWSAPEEKAFFDMKDLFK